MPLFYLSFSSLQSDKGRFRMYNILTSMEIPGFFKNMIVKSITGIWPPCSFPI